MLWTPRYYQEEAVDSIFNYFMTQTGNPIVAMPTGTGKSNVLAMFLERVYRHYPQQKIMQLTHVKELIQQNYAKLLSLWPGAPAGINSASIGPRAVHERIIFAGIGSVAKYAAQFGHVDLGLIDECHLVSPRDETMYQLFFAGLKAINPRFKLVGFTATPWRLGQGMITEDGGIFTDVCYDITGLEAFNKLIAEGYLCPLIPKKPKLLLNVDGVHMRGGEFIESELQLAVDKDEITRAAVLEMMEHGQDRKKWLIFASGVHHAQRISDMLADMNIDVPVVSSDKAHAPYRDKRISAFRSGAVRGLVNNNVLTTGLDVPDIDMIGVLRATASPVLWVQMLGRGTRPFPSKENCLVMDFAGNTKRLGPINDPVIPARKGKKTGKAPVRLCEMCETYNHASVKKCVNCGHVFPEDVKFKAEAGSDELVKGDLPVVEIFEVKHVTCAVHQKADRPDAVRVTYFCALNKKFDEYVCIAHEGYAGRKAKQWWKEHGPDLPVPDTAAALLDVIGSCRMPTHLRVWTNRKYPEIMSQCLDGSAFNTIVPGEAFEGPQVDVQAVNNPWKRNSAISSEIRASQRGENFGPEPIDDDIPF